MHHTTMTNIHEISVFSVSMLFDKDAGHKTYLEDVFENQGRIPGGEWGLSAAPWTDVVSCPHTKASIKERVQWALNKRIWQIFVEESTQCTLNNCIRQTFPNHRFYFRTMISLTPHSLQ